jgi:hypothetical protein
MSCTATRRICSLPRTDAFSPAAAVPLGLAAAAAAAAVCVCCVCGQWVAGRSRHLPQPLGAPLRREARHASALRRRAHLHSWLQRVAPEHRLLRVHMLETGGHFLKSAFTESVLTPCISAFQSVESQLLWLIVCTESSRGSRTPPPAPLHLRGFEDLTCRVAHALSFLFYFFFFCLEHKYLVFVARQTCLKQPLTHNSPRCPLLRAARVNNECACYFRGLERFFFFQ